MSTTTSTGKTRNRPGPIHGNITRQSCTPDYHNGDGERRRSSRNSAYDPVEDLRDGYFELDTTGAFTYLNKSLRDLFGLSMDDLNRSRFCDALDGPSAFRALRAGHRVYVSGRPERACVLRVAADDGGRAILECSISPMQDEQGRMCGFKGMAREIAAPLAQEQQPLQTLEDLQTLVDRQTGRIKELEATLANEDDDRKLVKDTLRETDKALRAIFQCSPAAVISLDRDGNVTMWNPAAVSIFGWKEYEILGRPYPGVPAYEQRKFREVVKAPAGKKLTDLVLRRQRKDGAFISVSASLAPIEDGTGQVVGMMAVMIDISGRKETEADLMKAKQDTELMNQELSEVNRELRLAMTNAEDLAKQAEKANQAKSMFLANMSHEIRTPLNAVIGFTDILLETSLDKTQKDYTNTIKRSGEALLSLVNDILDFSKIEAGKLHFEHIEFDPELIAYDVCELIRPKIGRRPVEVLCRIGDHLTSKVKGDPGRLRQVLTNLMGNASKFTHSGEIELSMDIEEARDHRVKMHVTVRDTGLGIAQDRLAQIFEPFQQADGSTTRKYGGTGLGLSICKQIAGLLKGDIWVESKIGEGSVFHFTAWFDKAAEKTRRKQSPDSLHDKRALIVDDNDTNLDILRHLLQSHGMRVTTFSRNRGVFPVLKEAALDGAPFDVLILDTEMRWPSAYQLARKIRTCNSPLCHTPLLAVSASSDSSERKSEEAGFDGYLQKPVSRTQILELMERTLAKARDQKRAAHPRGPVTPLSVSEDAKPSLRILLAEDNLVNQKLARLMLCNAGYQVDVANNGHEAFELVKSASHQYDLVFMDIQMPEMDGLQTTRLIREAGFAELPIIALTANALGGDRQECLRMGMNDYLAKPIRKEKILEMVQKWALDKKNPAQEDPQQPQSARTS